MNCTTLAGGDGTTIAVWKFHAAAIAVPSGLHFDGRKSMALLPTKVSHSHYLHSAYIHTMMNNM